jgi:hypothetical protein
MSFYINQRSFVSIDGPKKGKRYLRDLKGNRYGITKMLHVVVVTGRADKFLYEQAPTSFTR